MTFWLLEIGLISILGQVVLLRELNTAFFGSELIYVLALGFWMLWSGVGAALGRRGSQPSPAGVRLLFLLASLLVLADVVFIRRIHLLFGGVPGAELGFGIQLAAMSLALLPVGLGLGLGFQWAAKLYVQAGRTLALAYAVESAGGVLGGAAATAALSAGFQNYAIALGCCFLSLAAALHPLRLRFPVGAPRPLFIGISLLAALLLVAAAWRGRAIDRELSAWSHPRLLESRDTPYGRVTVTGLLGQVSVFRNNALAFESEGTRAEELAHLAALQHPDPGRVLVLGGGGEGLVRELGQHRFARIDHVELDRRAWNLVRRFLPRQHLRSPAAGAVRTTFADPRAFLRASRERYDLILVAMPEPASAQDNRYYTQEFFRLSAGRLTGAGVLAFRLGSSENLWTPHLLRRAASIRRALRQSFSDVVVLPGASNLFLASRRRLSRDPEILSRRFVEREIEARLISPAYIRYLYQNDRFQETRRRLAETRAAVNTDTRPVCYQNTLIIWLSRFYPEIALRDLSFVYEPGRGGAAAGVVALLVLALVFWTMRRRPRPRRVLLAGMAGLLGMVLESALILHYQVKTGILYRDLGLLITLFMAGLACGSGGVHRLLGPGRTRRVSARRLGAAVLGAFILLDLAVAGLANAVAAPLGLSAVGLFFSGCLVAALFATASLHGVEEQRTVVSPLYAADLVGGCLGSLAASLFLIPVLGIQMTVLAAALLCLVSLLLL
jgi:spermidine synthase